MVAFQTPVLKSGSNNLAASLDFLFSSAGNNFFDEEVREKLTELEGKEERGAYILMERIQPLVIKNYKVRGNQPAQLEEMVSELGIYGIFVR